jgi:hypothetical protein
MEQCLYFGPGLDPDRFVMPPPPPAGALDARFATGSLVTTTDQAIRISGGTYPVRVTLDGTAEAALVSDGGANAGGGDAVTLVGPASRVSLRLGTSPSRPSSFTLQPGYPNPFNPVTVIGYALPVRSAVSIKVYNTLGQELHVLVDDIQAAGRGTATWNAAGSPSGVYLVRMEARPLEHAPGGAFVQAEKLILLK